MTNYMPLYDNLITCNKKLIGTLQYSYLCNYCIKSGPANSESPFIPGMMYMTRKSCKIKQLNEIFGLNSFFK